MIRNCRQGLIQIERISWKGNLPGYSTVHFEVVRFSVLSNKQSNKNIKNSSVMLPVTFSVEWPRSTLNMQQSILQYKSYWMTAAWPKVLLEEKNGYFRTNQKVKCSIEVVLTVIHQLSYFDAELNLLWLCSAKLFEIFHSITLKSGTEHNTFDIAYII